SPPVSPCHVVIGPSPRRGRQAPGFPSSSAVPLPSMPPPVRMHRKNRTKSELSGQGGRASCQERARVSELAGVPRLRGFGQRRASAALPVFPSRFSTASSDGSARRYCLNAFKETHTSSSSSFEGAKRDKAEA